jgi:hypothetical protein
MMPDPDSPYNAMQIVPIVRRGNPNSFQQYDFSIMGNYAECRQQLDERKRDDRLRAY